MRNRRAARPCHPDWVRSIRDQCQASGTPFWFKSWGEWLTGNPLGGDEMCAGKARAGRILDGRTWDEMPKGWEDDR